MSDPELARPQRLPNAGWLNTVYLFARDFGIFALLCLFFVYRNDEREKKLSSSIEELQTFQTETLVQMMMDNQKIVLDSNTTKQQNTAALDRNSAVIAELQRVLLHSGRGSDGAADSSVD